MPWNDTAQLNYLDPNVREAIIQTILHVARKFPIIRFDAAMTLAKKHYQRLWFPQPGSGGDIPSRAEHALTREQFDARMPVEFWREVVDRVAAEAPDTLLLAEAFWLMEGYFVRTLGMHRVYNSAFMNLLRNEDNAEFRKVLKNTLEFDPEILKRYVNFMNNPDEKTAQEQFGDGDKYFGICTLMATMPGLPMFGHGQVEGFTEKYGMEYYRPYWEEEPDSFLMERHEKDIFPLLKRRDLFSGIKNFLLYDFFTGEGTVNEDVFAYSNGNQYERALIVYHNHFGSTRGWIHQSASYLNKDADKLENTTLFAGLGLKEAPNQFVIFKDSSSNLEFIRSSQEIQHRGLYFELDAYECHVLIEFRCIQDLPSGQYAHLDAYLNGRGVPSIDGAIQELMLAPILTPMKELINADSLRLLNQSRVIEQEQKINAERLQIHEEKFRHFLESIKDFVSSDTDIHSVVKENYRGLEAILKLPVFASRYPFPGSKKYEKILKNILHNLGDYPFVWYVLMIWNDLRLMGQVITLEDESADISRSWLEEWGMQQIIHDILLDLGLDSGQAQSGVTMIKLLITQQNWVFNLNDQTSLGLMESWLSREDIRSFLNVNRYREKLWFTKESFESLLWWMMTIALIRSVADPEISLAESVEYLFDAYQLTDKILTAGTESEYQIQKLLDGLK